MLPPLLQALPQPEVSQALCLHPQKLHSHAMLTVQASMLPMQITGCGTESSSGQRMHTCQFNDTQCGKQLKQMMLGET